VAELISLRDVRAHLRMPATFTADDQMLQQIYIPAAQETLEVETGISVPTEFDEYYDGGDFSIWLRHIPVLTVNRVEEGWGWTNFELSYVQVNSTINAQGNPIYAYSIDDPEQGEITRRYGASVPAPFMVGEANIHVTYVAGRQNTPATLYLAGLELVSHWYQNTQQRVGAGGNAAGYDAVNMEAPRSGPDAAIMTINQGVPNRILELIKKYRRTPIIG
jgi:hypothetical protein